MIWNITFLSVKTAMTRLKQDSIPVACVPPTCQLYMFCWPPLDVSITPLDTPTSLHCEQTETADKPLADPCGRLVLTKRSSVGPIHFHAIFLGVGGDGLGGGEMGIG